MISAMLSSLFAALIHRSQSVAKKVMCVSICDLDWFDIDLAIQFHNLEARFVDICSIENTPLSIYKR